jgi:hypothetical protein
MFCVISFKEHLPEDGHNKWPKHVGGEAVYKYNKFTYLFMQFLVLFLILTLYCMAWELLKRELVSLNSAIRRPATSHHKHLLRRNNKSIAQLLHDKIVPRRLKHQCPSDLVLNAIETSKSRHYRV